MAKQAHIYIGRRKNAVARVFLTPAVSGQEALISINGRTFENFFPNSLHRDDVVRPFKVTNTFGSFSVQANVNGGGTTGQSGAVRLAIARALSEMNEENKPLLRKADLMTRDPRMVERKKPGQPGARKKFQFSKR
ncbi:MAG: 30S ribosomal protein S9 [Bacteroidota bacterium]|nr:30S ribosomal protein S9 [Bacteroidota bacterium]MDP4233751.1 30S ribosomal protein S9 [Bacteroidota bacterium]MDP4242390.1 30S ribosomal protein S9 [Bacteroidota bacterium]MDP4287512.1 30S ribosomal protein S9 [Bacteroidota bacterium]